MEDWIEQERILFPKGQKTVVWETKDALLQAIDSGDVPTSNRMPLLQHGLPDLDFWVGRRVGFGTPRFRRLESELRNPTQPLSSWIVSKSESSKVKHDENTLVSGTNDEGTTELGNLFGSRVFDHPKPVSLIKELVRQSTGPDDLVLDFFAGSATTGQAVMELNFEETGQRRFVLVSSSEATSDEPSINVCQDITAERVRKLNADDSKHDALSAGFAYLRCREINPLEIDDALTPETAWSILEAHHGFPLTTWPEGKSAVVHENDGVALILVDRWDEFASALIEKVSSTATELFLYAFAPGQVTGLKAERQVEVRGVRETLQRLYAA